ncbi:hypothetical protein LO762_23485 [Actinocorallia sp. API 0066]|uniref:hypothetical protein n=1 Tax=Actinocorallia sp. API 0066 TaxID=2896846 RepID=UPI001E6544C3|nr:hypothetical protein [Actinocorallia sp. API 0066]MCD0452131.1 hypothetical protein [Actinocorallia sp. API 0066]
MSEPARVELPVRAPAESVYRLLADLDAWPRVFGRFVHLERLGVEDGTERVGVWSVSGDGVRYGEMRRRLRARELRVEFRFPDGSRTEDLGLAVTALSERESLVRVTHGAARADDLSSVRAAAESEFHRPELRLVLRDVRRVAASPRDVFDFLYAADRWPEHMPHVAAASLRRFPEGGQLVEVVTRESGGGLLTTRNARVGRAPGLLVYKQLLLPPIGASHCVRWRIGESSGATVLTALQEVTLRAEGVVELLGPDADLSVARDFARRELGGKMRLLLDCVSARAAGR